MKYKIIFLFPLGIMYAAGGKFALLGGIFGCIFGAVSAKYMNYLIRRRDRRNE